MANTELKNLIPTLIPASQIKFKTFEWDWNKWIVSSAVNIFCGQGGCGKTSFALSYSHNQIMGNHLPVHTPTGDEIYGLKGDKKKTIYIGEDVGIQGIPVGLSKYLGTDMEKIHFPGALKKKRYNKGKENPNVGFSMAHHTFKLLESLAENEVRSKEIGRIIIDPMTSLLSGSKNSHNSVEVRDKLSPLLSFTQDTETTIIGICHSAKNHLIGEVSDMMGGSTAIRDLARSVLGFIKCNSLYPNTTLMLKVKTNYSSLEDGWLFKCLPVEMEKNALDDYGKVVEDMRYVDFETLKPVVGSPHELREKYCKEKITNTAEQDIEKILERDTKLADCIKFITEYVNISAKTNHWASDLHRERKKKGFTLTTYQRACKMLKAIPDRDKKTKKYYLTFPGLPEKKPLTKKDLLPSFEDSPGNAPF